MIRVTTRALVAAGAAALFAACAPAPSERGATVLFASGADLQSINPLLTVHPLARQVQKYLLLTTLARYDSALRPVPYLARDWRWSDDHRTLTLWLHSGARWTDGAFTTARDAAWTLDAARAPATGYPRATDLADLTGVEPIDDTTLVLRYRSPQRRFPDVLTDLAILPAHLLDTVPPARLRSAAWNEVPVGNGPFRFVRHDPQRRWVFARNPDFPAALGGPPRLERFVLAIVDEPVTKLAALVSGELDFAGIQPSHAAYVRRDPHLAVLDYPLLFTYGIVLNTRRPPFDRLAARLAVNSAVDRREIVEAYVWGYGTPATGPVPPGVPGALAIESAGARSADSAGAHSTRSAGARPTQGTGASAAAVGWDSAPRTRVELLTVGSGEGALEQLIQARLRRVGFDVVIRQLELSAFLARLYGPAHDFDAAVLGVPGDLGLGYLQPLAALAGMAAPRDPGAAQRFFADSVPVAFLYHARGVQGMNRRVHGVAMDLRGELVTVHDWWVSR
ncbi:MAG TPA: ABC transporter substrate-binding protein [Gemmatimonadales bacterium]|nr:ABC transporter substrate-binding protein [Gemmatimonadales bacterium]